MTRILSSRRHRRLSAVTLAVLAPLALWACSSGGGGQPVPDGVADPDMWRAESTTCMRRADRLAARELDRGATGGSALSADFARMDARKARDRYWRSCMAQRGQPTD